MSLDTLITTIFQSAWPQPYISPCSYQSNLVIALFLLCLAAPFLIVLSCFVYIFVRRKVCQLNAASEAIHQRILLYNN